MKAKIIKAAGQNDSNQALFAIIDEFGRTVFQIWSTEKEINNSYKLI